MPLAIGGHHTCGLSALALPSLFVFSARDNFLGSKYVVSAPNPAVLPASQVFVVKLDHAELNL